MSSINHQKSKIGGVFDTDALKTRNLSSRQVSTFDREIKISQLSGYPGSMSVWKCASASIRVYGCVHECFWMYHGLWKFTGTWVSYGFLRVSLSVYGYPRMSGGLWV